MSPKKAIPPRRPARPKPAPAAVVRPVAIAPSAYSKVSLTIASDVMHAARVAAVLEHRVSESALVEVALRRFLELPSDQQAKALAGIGRRRKNATP